MTAAVLNDPKLAAIAAAAGDATTRSGQLQPSPHHGIDIGVTVTHDALGVPATTSVTRTYAHLHYPAFVALSSTFSAMRTAFYHPMTFALTRKQGLQGYGQLSTREVLTRAYRTEGGGRVFTTGMLTMVLANSVSEGLYAGVYEWLRFSAPFESEVTRDAAAGYIGDFSSRFIYTPMLLISSRQMTQTAPCLFETRAVVPRSENNFRGVVRSVYKEGGPTAFFKGIGATLTVGCAWTAVWWPMYNQSKKLLYNTVGPRLPEPDSPIGKYIPEACLDRYDNVALNGVASLITSASTAMFFNPFLVVRTRLQIQARATMLGVVRQVYKERGMAGFFTGATLNVSSCVVDGILAAQCYEWAKYLADATHYTTVTAHVE